MIGCSAGLVQERHLERDMHPRDRLGIGPLKRKWLKEAAAQCRQLDCRLPGEPDDTACGWVSDEAGFGDYLESVARACDDAKTFGDAERATQAARYAERLHEAIYGEPGADLSRDEIRDRLHVFWMAQSTTFYVSAKEREALEAQLVQNEKLRQTSKLGGASTSERFRKERDDLLRAAEGIQRQTGGSFRQAVTQLANSLGKPKEVNAMYPRLVRARKKRAKSNGSGTCK